MERWAKDGRFASSVRFLCVCLDSVWVAQQFGRMFDFQHVVNCQIPSREYFPRNYGQLGCSGFIVADKQGNFVSRKTRAFLQYGEAAFVHVEELLLKQLPAGPQATFSTMRNSSPLSSATDEKKAEAVKVVPVPSVGVDCMDDEHASCEAALAVLLRTNTVQSLETVVAELMKHFDHEEQVMKAHKFGSGDHGAFSPYESHCQDHERILNIGFRALRQAKNPCESSTAASTGS